MVYFKISTTKAFQIFLKHFKLFDNKNIFVYLNIFI